jgi:hypothetical protein
MKKLFTTIFLISIFATFAIGQKTVRSFRKKIAEQQKIEQAKPENVDAKKEALPKTSSQSLYDVPLKILYKSQASRRDGQDCSTGVVRLRVQFLENGKIGQIYPISTMPYGKTESAIEAAKLIKFQPAMKDGKPVAVNKVIEYSFTIY